MHDKASVVIPKLGQGLAKVEAQPRPLHAKETLELVYVAHVKLPIVDVIQVFLGKAGLFQHLLQVHVAGLGHVAVGRRLVYGCICRAGVVRVRVGEHGLGEGIYVVVQVGFVVEDVVLVGFFLMLLTLTHVFVDVLLMFTYDKPAKIQPGHDNVLFNHADIKNAGNPLVEPGVINDNAKKNEENEGKLNVGDLIINGDEMDKGNNEQEELNVVNVNENEERLNMAEEMDEKKGKDAVQVKAV